MNKSQLILYVWALRALSCIWVYNPMRVFISTSELQTSRNQRSAKTPKKLFIVCYEYSPWFWSFSASRELSTRRLIHLSLRWTDVSNDKQLQIVAINTYGQIRINFLMFGCLWRQNVLCARRTLWANFHLEFNDTLQHLSQIKIPGSDWMKSQTKVGPLIMRHSRILLKKLLFLYFVCFRELMILCTTAKDLVVQLGDYVITAD